MHIERYRKRFKNKGEKKNIRIVIKSYNYYIFLRYESAFVFDGRKSEIKKSMFSDGDCSVIHSMSVFPLLSITYIRISMVHGQRVVPDRFIHFVDNMRAQHTF